MPLRPPGLLSYDRRLEVIGVGNPEIAAVQVLAVEVAVAARRRFRPLDRVLIKDVVHSHGEAVVLRHNVGRTHVNNRVVLVFVAQADAGPAVVADHVPLGGGFDVGRERSLLIVGTQLQAVTRQFVGALPAVGACGDLGVSERIAAGKGETGKLRGLKGAGYSVGACGDRLPVSSRRRKETSYKSLPAQAGLCHRQRNSERFRSQIKARLVILLR